MPRISKRQQEIQSTWETKISRAKKVRENWKELFKVELAYDYFEGRQKDPSYDDADWITINNIYAHVKSQLPALYSADPYFYIKVRRSYSPEPEQIVLMEKKAKVRQAMLNYLKAELDLKSKMRLCIFDAFFRYGVIKIHYTADEAENPNFGKAFLAEDNVTPLVDETSGDPLQEPEYIPINERYNLTRVHPDDFLFDEDAGPLESDWKWCAQRVRMTLDEAKKNKRYNMAALKRLEGKGEEKGEEERARETRKKGSDVSGISERREGKKKPDKEPEIVSFWEIYNLEKQTYLVVAENGEFPIIEESPLPPGVERLTFAILRFTLRDDSPYPIPPLSQGLDVAKEYNRARSDIQKHRKRFNRKYIGSKQAWGQDSGELSKIESGDDGTIALCNGDANGALAPVKDAPLDPMRYSELSYLKAEMVELLGGSTEEARGIAGADTATQAGILDKRLEMREGDSMSMVIDFIQTIARKLDQLVQANITKDEAVRVSGPQGEYWEFIRASDYEEIEGEFEYSVNVGATIPQLPQMERASLLAFLGLLSNFPHLATSKRLMTRMLELHHIEDEALIEELYEIAQIILSGKVPPPGASGSQPGVSENRPESAVGGQAGGGESLIKGNAAIGG